jgi:hypothetical protein
LLSLSNGGGYGLFVNGSNLITEPIWTFTEFVATIELLVPQKVAEVPT